MKDSYFTTIYNIPEEISGLGFIAHFIGFCLFPALIICAIPCVLIDDTWIKDSIELIISSGILVTLGCIFILIICPIYFFIRFVMEFFRYKKAKQKFYSTPNIEYIKLNDEEIFIKNTYPKLDFSIRRSDIVNVILDGKVKSVSYLKATRTPGVATYIENLTLTIKTTNESYTIYPQIKSKHIPKNELVIDEIELLKQQIAFYKSYFDNIDVRFNFSGTDTYSETISTVKTYELENDISKKSTNYFDIIYKIVLVGIFIYFIYEMFFVLK
ncbi:hypothetical protein IJ579_01100 [bacterium]|nr:hypothetical protein [bacterium]